MTTTIDSPPNSEALILKTDTRGRVVTPAPRREALLDEFERSGLSGARFAKLTGIKYQTFAAWAARRRQQRGVARAPAKAADPIRWLEAVVAKANPDSSSEPGCPLKLHLPAGSWIELSDARQVVLAAALIQALEKRLPSC